MDNLEHKLFNSRESNTLFEYIDNIHPNIKFTEEKDTNNTINFLDLMITRQNGRFGFYLHRKLAQQYQMIHTQSLNNFHEKEIGIIEQIATENG